MAGGDIERLHSVPGAVGDSHLLVIEKERHAMALSECERSMLSAQPAFGAADGRHVQAQPKVRGESEPPWMSYPLSIAKQDLGFTVELSKCLDKWRNFPEGQEAGDIWEWHCGDYLSCFKQFETRPLECEHDGDKPVDSF